MRARLRLSSVELLATGLGAGLGLVATAPLLWLAVEAQRTGDLGLSRAAQFYLGELLVLWLAGALVGGLLAALLSRALVSPPLPRQPVWTAHLLHLLLGAIIIMILAPSPAAGLLALASGRLDAFIEFYLVGGSLIGWQSGVITFVFLYTFKTAERFGTQRSNGT